jgi:putative acetyltransferase
MMMAVSVRPETGRDHAAIWSVNEEVFGRCDEADLVERLRSDHDLVLSWVALAERVVGYIAFSRLHVEGATVRVSALAPMAVRPGHQRRGVGTQLIQDALARLAAMGEDIVLVLGEPAFYGRFGFRRETAARLNTPYDGPYLQALALTEAGRLACGVVRYPDAFTALG